MVYIRFTNQILLSTTFRSTMTKTRAADQINQWLTDAEKKPLKPSNSKKAIAADTQNMKEFGYIRNNPNKATLAILRRSLSTMISQCTDPTNKRYHLYGGMGIKVWHSWCGDEGYDQLVKDYKYVAGHNMASIQRVDEQGDYEYNNCYLVHQCQPISYRHSPRLQRKMMAKRNQERVSYLKLRNLPLTRASREAPLERLSNVINTMVNLLKTTTQTTHGSPYSTPMPNPNHDSSKPPSPDNPVQVYDQNVMVEHQSVLPKESTLQFQNGVPDPDRYPHGIPTHQLVITFYTPVPTTEPLPENTPT